ncbi:MAG: hypothetical protein D6814_09545, partial [Calditrichaeota bacterium]
MKKYIQQTKSLALSFLAILPLVLTYEFLIIYYSRYNSFEIRNAAEKFLKDLLAHAGITFNWELGLIYILLTLGVLIYERSRRNLKFPQVSFWGLLLVESLVYATFLGKGTQFLAKLVLSAQGFD